MNWWIEEYKKYHAELETNYPGNNLKPQLLHVKDLVIDTKSKTLLDYGCGKGLQYTKWKHHEELGIDIPALYDPAVPQYKDLPDGPFDGVISTDVLEHIPEGSLPTIIEEIFSYSGKYVFCTAAIKKAGKILPNGKNAHATVQPKEWWKKLFEKYDNYTLDFTEKDPKKTMKYLRAKEAKGGHNYNDN